MVKLSKTAGLLWILSSFIQFTAIAQLRTDSLVSFRSGFGGSNWQFSQNPVFLKDSGVPQFGTAGFFGELVSGKFKRPQEFKKEQLFGFNAEGVRSHKNWKFYGSFNYGKHLRDSIKYSNVARPYDGNPFITADTVGGNWQGDNLIAKLHLAFPKFKRWQPAIKVVYQAEQSARDNDPKPLYRLLDYSIEPGVAYSLTEQQRISFFGSYQSSYEHTETGYFSDQNPILYSIRGYGEFSRGPVVSAERFRKGWGWQTGSDYQFKNANITLLAGARLGYRTADVNDGIAKPIFIGGFDETNAELLLSLEKKSHDRGWLINGKGWFKDGTGFDPVFQKVNPAYYFSGFNSRVSWWKQQNSKKWISLNLYPAITYTNYFESVAKTDWTSVMLHNEGGISVNYNKTKRTSFFAEILLGYHNNIQKSIIINRPTILSPTLVRPDYEFNSADYFNTTVTLSATHTTESVSYYLEGGLRLKNAFDRVQSPQLGGRNIFHTSLHLIF